MAVEAAQAPHATPVASARPLIHPAWVRVTHWINAVAVAADDDVGLGNL